MPRISLVQYDIKNIIEIFVCILSVIFASYSSWKTTHHASEVNFHCMLFGKIAEREKVFTEGVVPLCLAYLLTQYTLIIFGVYFLYQSMQYPKFNWTHSTELRKMWKGLFLYLICLHVVFLKGFHSVCNSLDAPTCSYNSLRHIEFKYFKPKYFNGLHFHDHFCKILISSVLNFLCLVCFFFSNTKKTVDATSS